jgi:AcrR family transcriptional regulator
MRRVVTSPKPKRGPAKPGRPASRRAPAERPYHHGDLRRVLVDAAFELVGEGGAEGLSVREAARRAGVSSGAPFRHFASREALLAAVAEEAQRRLGTEVARALAEAPADDPLQRFRSVGLAYLHWAKRNPAHFEVISSRRLFDHDKSAAVSAGNAEVIGLTERILEEAHARGLLGTSDLKQVLIGGRALVYGFARMATDGHFPRWGVAEAEVDRTAESILDLFISGIARRPGHR